MRDALHHGLRAADHARGRTSCVGKLRDLLTLAVIGVDAARERGRLRAGRGLLAGAPRPAGLDRDWRPSWRCWSSSSAGAADMLLFFAIFRLLVRPRLPKRSLWAGALLGAIGFELLKQLSSSCIGRTKDQPAFQAFGIALILLVWINYFSRVVVYAAAWALHRAGPRGVPAAEPDAAVAAVEAAPRPPCASAVATPEVPPSAWVGSGAALTLALRRAAASPQEQRPVIGSSAVRCRAGYDRAELRRNAVRQ